MQPHDHREDVFSRTPFDGHPIDLTLHFEDEDYGRVISRDEVKLWLIHALAQQDCNFVESIDFRPDGTYVTYKWKHDDLWQLIYTPLVVPESGLWVANVTSRAQRRRQRRTGQ